MAKKVIVGRNSKAKINTAGVTVGTSVTALNTNDRELDGGVQIVVDAGEAGTVYVGARSTLTAGSANVTDGFPLAAGETIFLPVAKESDIYVVANQSTQIHILSF